MSKKYWEWQPSFSIRSEDTAFLIVDMQKGFVDEGSCLEVPMARTQVKIIHDFQNFCHRYQIPVYMSVFAQGPDYCYDFYWQKNKERGLINAKGEYKFKIGSPECEITDALAPTLSDTIFTKYGYDCFAHTDLETWLKKQNIKTLIICGTVVNWCVDSTIRSAYHKDYNVVVMADGVSGYDHAGASGQQWVDMELDLFGEGFARVLQETDLKKEIQANKKKEEDSF